MTDDGITLLSRKGDWAFRAQLVRALPNCVEVRVLPPVPLDQTVVPYAIMRLTWDRDGKGGSGWTEREFWASLPTVSQVRARTLSKDNMLQLDDVRLLLANKGGKLTVRQHGGLFENV